MAGKIISPQKPADASVDSSSLEADVPVSSYSLSSTEYPIENLEVRTEGSGSVPKSSSVGNAATIGSVPFSRRKATLISLGITIVVVLATAVSLAQVIRRSTAEKTLIEYNVPTQSVPIDGANQPFSPTVIEGQGLSVLVGADLITRGQVKIASGDFFTTIQAGELTGNQSVTLPAESGELCLDSNNCNFASQNDVTALQGEVGQLSAALGVGGVTSLNGQAGALLLQGSQNRIAVTTNNGVVTISTPQNLHPTASVQFGNITLSQGGQILANTIRQTAAGNNVTISALNDDVVIISNGRNFLFPSTGLATQIICTNSGNCGGGGGAVDSVNSMTGFITIQGTVNQVNIANDGLGTITLSTPQDIATTSSPTFNNLTLSGDLAVNGGDITTTALTANVFNNSALTLNVGNAATAINVGTGAVANAVTIGNYTSGSQLTLQGSTVSVGNNAATLNMGTSATAVNIATGAVANITTIGSYTSGSQVIIRGSTSGQGIILSAALSGVEGDILLEGRHITLDADGVLNLGTTTPSNIVIGRTSADTSVNIRGATIIGNHSVTSTTSLTVHGRSGQTGNLQEWRTTSGGTLVASMGAGGNFTVDTDTLFVDAVNNRVGIGTTTPATALQVTGSGMFGDRLQVGPGDTIDQCTGSYSIFTPLPCDAGLDVKNGSDGTQMSFGTSSTLNVNATSSSSATNTGSYSALYLIGNQNYTGAANYGAFNEAYSLTSGNVTTLVGTLSRVVAPSGTVGTAAALQGQVSIASAGTAYGLDIQSATGGITNNYGIRVASQTAGTNDYGIYIEGADTYALWVDSGYTKLDGSLSVGNVALPSDSIAMLAYQNFTTGFDCAVGCAAIVGAATIDANAANPNVLVGVGASVATEAGSFTLAQASGVFVQSASLGAGSTITDNYGIHIQNQIVGTNNYGLYIEGASTYALWVDSGTSRFDGDLEFEGATDDAFATTLTVADPTANNTIILPNASGTVCLTSGNCAGVGGTGDVLQGGNSYGSIMTIGTNDAYSLRLETSGVARLHIDASGGVQVLSNSFAVNGNTTLGDASGDNLTINGTNVSLPNNLNFDSNTLFIDASNNRIGIGNNAPSATLTVTGSGSFSGNLTVTDADFNVINGTHTLLRVDNTNDRVGIGLQDWDPLTHSFQTFATAGSTETLAARHWSFLYGSQTVDQTGHLLRTSVAAPLGTAVTTYTGTSSILEASLDANTLNNTYQAGYIATNISGTGTALGITGLQVAAGTSGANTVGTVDGIRISDFINASSTVATHNGLRVDNVASSGTLTDNYGIRIENQTAGTNDYGLYVAGADTYALWVDSGASRFDGNVTVEDADFTIMSGANRLFVVDNTNDRIGIGLPSYASLQYNIQTEGYASDSMAYGNSFHTWLGKSTNGDQTGHHFSSQFDDPSPGNTVNFNGLRASINGTATANTTTSTSQALRVDNYLNGSGSMAVVQGMAVGTNIDSTATVGYVTGIQVRSEGSSATVSNNRGIEVVNPTVGTITDNAAIYIHNQTAGTNDYGLYIAGADTYALWVDSGTSRFDGNVGINNPTAPNLLNLNTLTTADNAAQLAVATGGASNKGIIIQAALSQSADLFQAQDSTGAVLARISAVGDLTVVNATVNGTLTVNGNVTINGHVISGNSSGSTTVVQGSAADCSGTGSASISGNDTAGTITINSSTGVCASGTLATVTFANAYGAPPRVILTPKDADGATLQYFNGTSGTTSFTIDTGTAAAPSTSYEYNYQIIE